MRITKRIELTKKIAEFLNQEYDFTEIKTFFKAFDVIVDEDQERTIIQDIKVTLQQENNKKLIEIAEELEIAISEHVVQKPPKNWENNVSIKAFISHLSKDSIYAMKLRNELKKYNIDSFVAHEDIKPTEEWQEEIDKALQTMDFFISMHTEGFAESVWCQQEIGYALARAVKIIPIKFDGKEDPKGFIARIQALFKSQTKLAPELAKDIVELLKSDEKTKYLYEESNNKEEEIIEDEIPF